MLSNVKLKTSNICETFSSESLATWLNWLTTFVSLSAGRGKTPSSIFEPAQTFPISSLFVLLSSDVFEEVDSTIPSSSAALSSKLSAVSSISSEISSSTSDSLVLESSLKLSSTSTSTTSLSLDSSSFNSEDSKSLSKSSISSLLTSPDVSSVSFIS